MGNVRRYQFMIEDTKMILLRLFIKLQGRPPQNIDVVLVDTAGRMQHSEPLMRALLRRVTINNPDLVLIVGEILIGSDGVLIVNSPKDNVREIDAIILSKFDTVDEKVGAALSLTSATGKLILFVGVGQKYTHLKKLNVNTVV